MCLTANESMKSRNGYIRWNGIWKRTEEQTQKEIKKVMRFNLVNLMTVEDKNCT